MSSHQHQEDAGGLGGWLLSRTGIATAVAIAILAFLIYRGHSAHLLGALPYLLILACPLMHIFMHGGHGHHHGGQKSKSDEENGPNDQSV
ncbi:MAG: DUF2933 domain-containing protein [Rhodospirillaceae bacterium]|jgi:hypothetical protein